MQNNRAGRLILEFSENADCDLKATNIILQGLPAVSIHLLIIIELPKIYGKEFNYLMHGTSLTKQERECKLYDAFDKFTHIKGESLHNLPPEWSKFVTDVKLVKDLHTNNFDQLYAYLDQHKLHANEVRLLRERNQDPLAFVANQQMTPPHFNTYQSSYNNPQLQQQFPPSHYGLIHPNQHYSSTYPSQPHFNHSSVPTSFAIPVFSPEDDPIACLNKAMAFLIVVASSRFSSTNNQLRTSSNPRNHATIQDGRVTLQQVQGRQGQSYSGTGYKSNATSSGGNNASRQEKDKAMLAESQEARQILDEEQIAFLVDLGVPDGQAFQTIIPNNATFQTEDLDTYDSNCDDISNAKAVLMANISNYGFDVILEVPHSKTYLNDMENQSVHAMQDFEQTPVVDVTDNEITSDSNIISYSQYLQETQQANFQDTNLQAQQDSMILSKLALKEQVDSLEQNLSIQIKEKECLLQKFTVFKSESKKKEDKYMENKIDLEKKIKELDNILFKVVQSAQTVHMLTKLHAFYDNIHKQALGYQNPFYLRKAQRINKPSDASPMKIEAPKELPKVSLVNESLKKLKFLPLPGSSKKAKIVESKNANHSEPNHTWGSNVTDIPSSSSVVMTGTVRFRNDRIARIIGFLRSKYEAHEAIIKCIKNIQVRLNATVRNVRTDNGTEFVNQTLREFYENVGISHQTSITCTPQQNKVFGRQNQTLVEAARTMLIFSKASLFLWAEAINTACYTQNRSLIRLRYNKTPYELMQDKKPDLSFFHVFGALCYPINDNDDLGKLDAKADIGIFVGYAPAKKAFRIYNKRN
ncbi:retrovirus-related pol polyprotein from transposon TNT 1-94 [Tanacetum coccineum]